ncbi:methyltransferase domain-containing protein [Saccharopolyspora sp. TS4A08]|uniref:Methyltransferase domain-containing protein n=1 Tax=Saccharopolyspora ipomoeae TaxID=3042027 RepID=A0ABT6PQX5_9PSEU|nr:geranyl diphosphate 2-C-methyltransferase [Saccharopolyspora sp. TS4A08]MDI2030411.1 methyltransferase domain-containing protein [Saccharopolyspora sp. TS4A08]
MSTNTSVASHYQGSVADYWNREANPVNIELGEVDGYFHHHYGIGEPDWSVVEGDPGTARERTTRELHRLETRQAVFLLDHLGEVRPDQRIMDAGCGRGGSSFMAHDRFGCQVDGISISRKQVEFATEQAKEREVEGKVAFHLKNMLDTGFETGCMQAIWNNESTMYVDLHDLFAEHARLLARGGRYVTITGCYNDVYGLPSRAVSTINAHYICDIHPRSNYFRAMTANRLVPTEVVDMTEMTLPYWRLRAKSPLATGIEQTFIDAYTSGSFQYLLIAADRV